MDDALIELIHTTAIRQGAMFTSLARVADDLAKLAESLSALADVATNLAARIEALEAR